MNTQGIPKVIRRHILQATSQVMRVVVNHRKGQKQLKIAIHLKSTLARPPIYNWTYPKKLSTSSPSIPVVFTKPSLLLLFVQLDKKFLEESTKVEETYFFDNFWQQIPDKKSLAVETCIRTHCCTQVLNCSSIQVICITLRQARRAKLWILQKFIWKLIFLHKNFRSK